MSQVDYLNIYESYFKPPYFLGVNNDKQYPNRKEKKKGFKKDDQLP